ncbi:hypothetical protein SZN_37041, partial [Streptomyces zinciresistens K42]
MTPQPALTAPRRGHAPWHTALTLVVLLAAAYLVRRHWPVLHSGAVRLTLADQGWLLAAGVAALATWPCAALAQQGAVPGRLPQGRLLAGQFAATAANQVLPAGLGGGVVNLRLLTRCGLPFAAAATAITVKGTAGALVRAALIAGLLAVCPGVLRVPPAGGA